MIPRLYVFQLDQEDLLLSLFIGGKRLCEKLLFLVETKRFMPNGFVIFSRLII